MTIRILKPGLQTTVQAGPRSGMRHLGVPASGAADMLSLALANKLVGNAPASAALETTLTGVSLLFQVDTFVAVAGARAVIELNGDLVGQHRTVAVRAGDEFMVGPAIAGARNYVAIAGGIAVDEILGSASTYLPAGLGGFAGRALSGGDVIPLQPISSAPSATQTPLEFQPPAPTSWALRACPGAEIELLDADNARRLFDTNFSIGMRADRMGLQMEGPRLDVASAGRMPSAAVFPGTIQCPEDGQPFILSVDAQTTGGYPRVAQVARADRHLIGQLRPGNHVRLLRREPEAAIEDVRNLIHYWMRWLPDIGAII
jgi:biotin-dependent carboxylase-like uncharacterized protein